MQGLEMDSGNLLGMGRRPLLAAAAALAGALAAVGGAHAAGGIVPPKAEALWPQWQARVTLQTTALSPLAGATWADGSALAQRNGGGGIHGGAVLGDYVFASPSFGRFRASGGLLVGTQGGLPMGPFSAGPRLGVSLASQPAPAFGEPPSAYAGGTVPYLGLGFSGAPWRNGLSITADLGMVAESPAAGLGRARFGNQALEGSLRELRLSPVLQLGVRYAF
jgi:hypothetical protein